MKRALRIGSGAGFQGDRLDPALVLAERGELDYLGLECLGERTIALAQLRRRKDPAGGYDPLLERRMTHLLPLAKKHGITLVTNMGAANPLAAADAIVAIAREQRLAIKVAAVTGDDVLEQIRSDAPTIEARGTLADYGEPISANAYLGTAARNFADNLVAGLQATSRGPDIVESGLMLVTALAPEITAMTWSALTAWRAKVFAVSGRGEITMPAACFEQFRSSPSRRSARSKSRFSRSPEFWISTSFGSPSRSMPKSRPRSAISPPCLPGLAIASRNARPRSPPIRPLSCRRSSAAIRRGGALQPVRV